MNVKLISYTRPVEVLEDGTILHSNMTAEELIVYIARVSSNQHTENYQKLLTYLIKNKHWSPFEMVDITFEIITSRAIGTQLLRHRSFSFQEFSQRYAEATEIEPISLRKQAEKNRQSSTEEFDPMINSLNYPDITHSASHATQNLITTSKLLYHQLIKDGVARECARMILPLATQTKIYMKGSLRSWIHFLEVRDDDHAQKEVRDIAIEIRKTLESIFPVTFAAIAEMKQEQEEMKDYAEKWKAQFVTPYE